MTVAVRDQRQVSGAFDGRSQLALVSGLGAGDAAGDYLTGFRNVRFQGIDVFVINLFYPFGCEFAVSAAPEIT